GELRLMVSRPVAHCTGVRSPRRSARHLVRQRCRDDQSRRRFPKPI
ncbi:MAG: hypothetical protein AVDCRST_MAG59-2654, partial [uncultured Thermomicrobiales bacterium]